jgi:hypothetical protein
VRGGAGDDRLTDGRGRDTSSGGPGSDLFLALDGSKDRLDGGAGRDRARVDGGDVRVAIEVRLL